MTDFDYNSPSLYNPGHLRIQNREARGLIEFAIDTARSWDVVASDDAEIRRVSDWYQAEFWDGMQVDFAELIPDIASRRFWCRAFFRYGEAGVPPRVGQSRCELLAGQVHLQRGHPRAHASAGGEGHRPGVDGPDAAGLGGRSRVAQAVGPR